MDARPLAGKTALVTGASKGIGKAVSLLLAKEGALVLAVARKEAELAVLADEAAKAGGELRGIAGDVGDDRFVEGLFASVERDMGRLDILVNNAGIVDGGTDVEALPVEKFREVMNVNVVAVFHCMQKAVAIMRRHGDVGKIVNIGSVRSHWTEAGEAGAYNASKFALRGLSETVARLLIKGKSKIAVGMVCPGIVDTPIHDHWSPAGSPSRQEWLKPETVAEAVLHAIKAPENVNIMDTIVVPTMQAPF